MVSVVGETHLLTKPQSTVGKIVLQVPKLNDITIYFIFYIKGDLN